MQHSFYLRRVRYITEINFLKTLPTVLGSQYKLPSLHISNIGTGFKSLSIETVLRDSTLTQKKNPVDLFSVGKKQLIYKIG